MPPPSREFPAVPVKQSRWMLGGRPTSALEANSSRQPPQNSHASAVHPAPDGLAAGAPQPGAARAVAAGVARGVPVAAAQPGARLRGGAAAARRVDAAAPGVAADAADRHAVAHRAAAVRRRLRVPARGRAGRRLPVGPPPRRRPGRRRAALRHAVAAAPLHQNHARRVQGREEARGGPAGRGARGRQHRDGPPVCAENSADRQHPGPGAPSQDRDRRPAQDIPRSPKRDTALRLLYGPQEPVPCHGPVHRRRPVGARAEHGPLHRGPGARHPARGRAGGQVPPRGRRRAPRHQGREYPLPRLRHDGPRERGHRGLWPLEAVFGRHGGGHADHVRDAGVDGARGRHGVGRVREGGGFVGGRSAGVLSAERAHAVRVGQPPHGDHERGLGAVRPAGRTVWPRLRPREGLYPPPPRRRPRAPHDGRRRPRAPLPELRLGAAPDHGPAAHAGDAGPHVERAGARHRRRESEPGGPDGPAAGAVAADGVAVVDGVVRRDDGAVARRGRRAGCGGRADAVLVRGKDGGAGSSRRRMGARSFKLIGVFVSWN